MTVPAAAEDGAEYQPEQIPRILEELEREMRKASEALEFEKAAQLRDRILALKDLALGVTRKATGMKGLLGSSANLAAASAMGKTRGGARRPQMMRRRRR